MPIWLQILIPASILYLALSRRGAQNSNAAPQMRSDDVGRLWHAFYALQNTLVSLSRAVENVDTSLGVVLVVTITGFTYFRDKALDAAAHAQAVGDPVQHYPFVFGWLLLIPTALAVTMLVRFNAEEAVEIEDFIDALDQNEAKALRSMIARMSRTYDNNQSVRRLKQLGLIATVLLFVGILMLDAAWPSIVHALAWLWAAVVR